MTRLPLVLLLAAGTAAGTAQAQSVEQRLGDLRLATAVRLALVADPATRALDVEVTAEGGAVRLSGRGASDAARVAQGVHGVRSVDGVARGPVGAAPADAPGTRPAATSEPPSAPPAVRLPAAPRADAPRVDAPRADAPRVEASAEAAPILHTVSRGDTLFSLARRYATTVEALRQFNGLGPRDGIEIGRRLRVR